VLFRSVDMQEPTLIPTFAIPCTHHIRQCSGIEYEPERDERETDQLDSICTSGSCCMGELLFIAAEKLAVLSGETASGLRRNYRRLLVLKLMAVPCATRGQPRSSGVRLPSVGRLN